MGYLDNTGLAYFWEKIKSNFFPATKKIPENADLNDYKTPGAYCCPTNAAVATLDNAPTIKAFSLIVYRTGNSNSCVQFVSLFSTGLSNQGAQDDANRIFTRTYYWGDGWSPWAEIVTSLDRPVDYTSAGWTLDTYADHCWHKIATIKSTASTTDRRAIFSVTDSYWGGTGAPTGRPDLKYGILHVHIRKTVSEVATSRKLTWNLNCGYDPNDFLLVYNPVDDSDEIWTRVPNRWNFRTFNLIETGLVYGGNRYYQTSTNPIEMYGRVRDADGYASYPTGDGYAIVKSENSVIEQPSRGIVDLGVYYNRITTKRLTSANDFQCGDASLKYFNSTSSMPIAEGKPVHTKSLSGMDAHVLHLPWDNSGGYDSQIAIPNNLTQPADRNVIKTVQWRGGTGNTETLEDGTKVQTNWSDWQHIVDSQFVFDGVHPKQRYINHYGVCDTYGNNTEKKVDISNFELNDGAFVIVQFKYSNTSDRNSISLNVSDTGSKPIRYRGEALSSDTYLGENQVYMFVYDGNNWELVGSVDTNDVDRLKFGGRVKAFSDILSGNIAVSNGSSYFPLRSGNPFDVSQPILFAKTGIRANETGSDVYTQYNFNLTTTQVGTFEPFKPVYIKGTLNGNIFSPISTAPLTQTIPNTDDGYQYIYLGQMYNASFIQLTPIHNIYEYVNGSFCLYEPKASNSDIDSIFD